MTPAVPRLPTPRSLPFQVFVGNHTSKLIASLLTPTTRQIPVGSVPTSAGFAPAGSASVSVIVVSGRASEASAAHGIGCGWGDCACWGGCVCSVGCDCCVGCGCCGGCGCCVGCG